MTWRVPPERITNRRPVNSQSVAEGARNRATVLDALTTYWDEHGTLPSQREVARLTGLSRPVVSGHMKALADEGRLP